MRYVLFREDPNTHKEVYLVGMLTTVPNRASDPAVAIGFESATDAYAFASRHQPYLDFWHVGLR
jgi:hypothetical protein